MGDSLALLSLHGCPVARLGEKDTGGMNVYVLQLAKEFARRGRRVDVFSRRHDPDDPEIVHLEEGARVVHLDAGPFDAGKYDLVNYIPEFLAALREFRRSDGGDYDLIHSHYWLSAQAGAALSREWGRPHFVTFHTLAKTKLRARAGEREPALRQRIETRAMRDADRIIVSTREEEEDVVRLYGAPEGKVEIVPAGVDLGAFAPVDKEAARRALGIRERAVLLYVGRIEPLKGIEILLRALTLMECGNDLRLFVVGGDAGGDAETERLRALAAELGIADAVTFTGSVPQSVLPTYYSAADAFVLPSHAESFGLAALEAMACGVPVVVSRVGGLKTFIDGGVSGYLVPWRCPEAFAQRLDVLLASPELRDSMGRAAREKALEMGWDKAAERTLALYDAATAATRDWQEAAGD